MGGGGHNRQKRVVLCGSCAKGYALPGRGKVDGMLENINGQERPAKCPICQFQIVKVSRGEGYDGKGYNMCPRCFTEKPQEYGGSGVGGDFYCFQCTHPTCAQARGTKEGTIEVFDCPFCRAGGMRSGRIMLKQRATGKYVLGCHNNADEQDRCQYSLWLPQAASKVEVCGEEEGVRNLECNRCATVTNSGERKAVKKLKFVWKPGSVPPHYEREFIGCILCDETLKRDFDIRLPKFNQVRVNTRNPARRRGNGGRGSGGGRGRGRGRGQR